MSLDQQTINKFLECKRETTHLPHSRQAKGVTIIRNMLIGGIMSNL